MRRENMGSRRCSYSGSRDLAILAHSPASRAAWSRAAPGRVTSSVMEEEQLLDFKKRGLWGILALLVASLALLAAGCGGDDEDEAGDGGTTTEATGGGGGGDVEALPSSSCTAIE